MIQWPDFIPIGAVHHATFLKQSPPIDGPAYRDFLRRELASMKQVGFNSFNMECAWADLEVEEGEWDFERADLVRELCAEFDLRLLIWVWPEMTPRWFARQHPECAAVAADGFRSQSHSYLHPTAREYCRRFIHAVVGRYHRDPHLLAYDIGIESGLHWNQRVDSEAYQSRLFDYNEAAIDGYRRWLKQKYGDLDTLNHYYRAHWRDFERIEPPKMRFFRDQPMLVNQLNWLDWRLFMCDAMSDYIRFKAECVRQLDPIHPVGDQSHGLDPALWSQDVVGIAAGVDAVGTSVFTSNAPGDYMLANMMLDRHRSSDRRKPFWIWELRSGQNAWGCTGWGPSLSGGDIARFTWQALGQGARCIQYWNWRPHLGGLEVGGHGLTHRDGTLSDRALRAGQIAARLDSHADLLMSLHPPPARIAIHDSVKSLIVAAGESSDEQVRAATRGIYSALKSQGFAIDFIGDAELVAGGLSAYSVLCLPFSYVLDAEVARVIATWVEEGGYLFAGIWCAMKDGWGFGQEQVPGLGLDRVFGAREMRTEPAFDDADQASSDYGPVFGAAPQGRPAMRVLSGLREQGRLQKGDILRGFQYRSVLEAGEATQVLAAHPNGDPAVTLHQYGAGRALLFGSFPARAEEWAEDGLSRLLEDFAALAGVQPAALIAGRKGRQLEAKLLTNGRKALLIVLNSEEGGVGVEVSLPDGISYLQARDFFTGQHLPLQTGAMPCLGVAVPGREVRVIHLDVEGA